MLGVKKRARIIGTSYWVDTLLIVLINFVRNLTLMDDNMTTICKTLKVEKAEGWDYLRGRVRINKEDITGNGKKKIKRKDVCVIEVEETDRRVCRHVFRTKKGPGIIQMDFDTREELSVSKKRGYEFQIRKANQWERLIFYWHHPDMGINIATKLGVISITLSIFSFILSIIALTVGIISKVSIILIL